MASRDIRRAKARQGETVAESMEKRRQLHPALYVFSVVVLVVVVVTFVASPVAGKVGSAGHLVFGTWDGREIAWYPGSYFEQQRQAYARQAEQSGSSADVESQVYSIWYQAYQATTWHVAAVTQARRAGVEISGDALDTDLQAYAGYLDENGRFSEAKYNDTPLSERVATREHRAEELLAARYYADLQSGVRGGSKEKAFVASMSATERKFSFVTWEFSAFPDGEVRRYGEANAAKFRKAKLSRITVATEREAKQIATRLADSTASFAELAKAHSSDSYASAGGDMGWQYAYALEPDLEDKALVEDVLSLAEGAVGDPVKGPFGWAIYRCDAAAVPADFTDAATLTEVRTYLNRYEKGKIEDWFVERAGKFARRAAESGFAPAAREAGLSAAETGYFPINLSNAFLLNPLTATPEEATPYSAAYSEDFFFRAFSLGKDQASSQPIVLDDRVLVLRVADERSTPAETATLSGQVLAYLANQSLQSDLSQELMGEKRLKSDFDATFARSVLGTRS